MVIEVRNSGFIVAGAIPEKGPREPAWYQRCFVSLSGVGRVDVYKGIYTYETPVVHLRFVHIAVSILCLSGEGAYLLPSKTKEPKIARSIDILPVCDTM